MANTVRDVSIFPLIRFRSSAAAQVLTVAGCGSDTLQKDLELDKLRVEEYIRENIHALKLFPASDLAEKDKILLPHWVYGFVLRSRKWGKQQ